MRVCSVVGARPQFVKAAPVSTALANADGDHEEILVHTGQHYDDALSSVFFDELDVPEPAYHLGVARVGICRRPAVGCIRSEVSVGHGGFST